MYAYLIDEEVGERTAIAILFDAVRPGSTQTESFENWPKAIYLCDSSYELEATLVAAVATNPSSWTEWRQMAGLYTLLMDVLLSDSAKMFSRVEILEKPFFIEILERVRRRSNRSFLMCHRFCKMRLTSLVLKSHALSFRVVVLRHAHTCVYVFLTGFYAKSCKKCN